VQASFERVAEAPPFAALGDAGINLLEQGARGTDGGSAGRLRTRKAKPQQQLLVLLVELENLENPRACVLEQIPRLGFAYPPGGYGAEGVERLVEASQQRAFALDEFGRKRALVLAEKTVLLERALVDLVTELLVLLQGFGWSHGRLGKKGWRSWQSDRWWCRKAWRPGDR